MRTEQKEKKDNDRTKKVRTGKKMRQNRTKGEDRTGQKGKDRTGKDKKVKTG